MSNKSRANNRYDKENYDRLYVIVAKGMRDKLRALAEAEGVTLNRYIIEAVESKSGLELTLNNALPWFQK